MYSLSEAQHNVRNHKFDLQLNSIDHFFKTTSTINANEIVLPANVDEMIKIAEILSQQMQCVRVDLYNIDGRIYFGELTLWSGGGFINIADGDYSQQIANYIDLSKK